MRTGCIAFLVYAAIIAAVAVTGGCRGKRAAVTETSSGAALTDTTRTVTDVRTQTSEAADTTKTSAEYAAGALVVFADGGGKVSVDSAGNVTLEGVAAIRGTRKGSFAEAKGKSQKETTDSVHAERQQGIAAQGSSASRTEQPQERVRWYDTLFAKVGQAVCLAALLWLLFLYLRRRR